MTDFIDDYDPSAGYKNTRFISSPGFGTDGFSPYPGADPFAPQDAQRKMSALTPEKDRVKRHMNPDFYTESNFADGEYEGDPYVYLTDDEVGQYNRNHVYASNTHMGNIAGFLYDNVNEGLGAWMHSVFADRSDWRSLEAPSGAVFANDRDDVIHRWLMGDTNPYTADEGDGYRFNIGEAVYDSPLVPRETRLQQKGEMKEDVKAMVDGGPTEGFDPQAAFDKLIGAYPAIEDALAARRITRDNLNNVGNAQAFDLMVKRAMHLTAVEERIEKFDESSWGVGMLTTASTASLLFNYLIDDPDMAPTVLAAAVSGGSSAPAMVAARTGWIKNVIGVASKAKGSRYGKFVDSVRRNKSIEKAMEEVYDSSGIYSGMAKLAWAPSWTAAQGGISDVSDQMQVMDLMAAAGMTEDANRFNWSQFGMSTAFAGGLGGLVVVPVTRNMFKSYQAMGALRRIDGELTNAEAAAKLEIDGVNPHVDSRSAVPTAVEDAHGVADTIGHLQDASGGRALDDVEADFGAEKGPVSRLLAPGTLVREFGSSVMHLRDAVAQVADVIKAATASTPGAKFARASDILVAVSRQAFIRSRAAMESNKVRFGDSYEKLQAKYWERVNLLMAQRRVDPSLAKLNLEEIHIQAARETADGWAPVPSSKLTHTEIKNVIKDVREAADKRGNTGRVEPTEMDLMGKAAEADVRNTGRMFTGPIARVFAPGSAVRRLLNNLMDLGLAGTKVHATRYSMNPLIRSMAGFFDPARTRMGDVARNGTLSKSFVQMQDLVRVQALRIMKAEAQLARVLGSGRIAQARLARLQQLEVQVRLQGVSMADLPKKLEEAIKADPVLKDMKPEMLEKVLPLVGDLRTETTAFNKRWLTERYMAGELSEPEARHFFVMDGGEVQVDSITGLPLIRVRNGVDMAEMYHPLILKPEFAVKGAEETKQFRRMFVQAYREDMAARVVKPELRDPVTGALKKDVNELTIDDLDLDAEVDVFDLEILGFGTSDMGHSMNRRYNSDGSVIESDLDGILREQGGFAGVDINGQPIRVTTVGALNENQMLRLMVPGGRRSTFDSAENAQSAIGAGSVRDALEPSLNRAGDEASPEGLVYVNQIIKEMGLDPDASARTQLMVVGREGEDGVVRYHIIKKPQTVKDLTPRAREIMLAHKRDNFEFKQTEFDVDVPVTRAIFENQVNNLRMLIDNVNSKTTPQGRLYAAAQLQRALRSELEMARALYYGDEGEAFLDALTLLAGQLRDIVRFGGEFDDLKLEFDPRGRADDGDAPGPDAGDSPRPFGPMPRPDGGGTERLPDITNPDPKGDPTHLFNGQRYDYPPEHPIMQQLDALYAMGVTEAQIMRLKVAFRSINPELVANLKIKLLDTQGMIDLGKRGRAAAGLWDFRSGTIALNKDELLDPVKKRIRPYAFERTVLHELHHALMYSHISASSELGNRATNLFRELESTGQLDRFLRTWADRFWRSEGEAFDSGSFEAYLDYFKSNPHEFFAEFGAWNLINNGTEDIEAIMAAALKNAPTGIAARVMSIIDELGDIARKALGMQRKMSKGDLGEEDAVAFDEVLSILDATYNQDAAGLRKQNSDFSVSTGGLNWDVPPPAMMIHNSETINDLAAASRASRARSSKPASRSVSVMSREQKALRMAQARIQALTKDVDRELTLDELRASVEGTELANLDWYELLYQPLTGAYGTDLRPMTSHALLLLKGMEYRGIKGEFKSIKNDDPIRITEGQRRSLEGIKLSKQDEKTIDEQVQFMALRDDDFDPGFVYDKVTRDRPKAIIEEYTDENGQPRVRIVEQDQDLAELRKRLISSTQRITTETRDITSGLKKLFGRKHSESRYDRLYNRLTQMEPGQLATVVKLLKGAKGKDGKWETLPANFKDRFRGGPSGDVAGRIKTAEESIAFNQSMVDDIDAAGGKSKNYFTGEMEDATEMRASFMKSVMEGQQRLERAKREAMYESRGGNLVSYKGRRYSESGRWKRGLDSRFPGLFGGFEDKFKDDLGSIWKNKAFTDPEFATEVAKMAEEVQVYQAARNAIIDDVTISDADLVAIIRNGNTELSERSARGLAKEVRKQLVPSVNVSRGDFLVLLRDNDEFVDFYNAVKDRVYVKDSGAGVKPLGQRKAAKEFFDANQDEASQFDEGLSAAPNMPESPVFKAYTAIGHGPRNSAGIAEFLTRAASKNVDFYYYNPRTKSLEVENVKTIWDAEFDKPEAEQDYNIRMSGPAHEDLFQEGGRFFHDWEDYDYATYGRIDNKKKEISIGFSSKPRRGEDNMYRALSELQKKYPDYEIHAFDRDGAMATKVHPLPPASLAVDLTNRRPEIDDRRALAAIRNREAIIFPKGESGPMEMMHVISRKYGNPSDAHPSFGMARATFQERMDPNYMDDTINEAYLEAMQERGISIAMLNSTDAYREILSEAARQKVPGIVEADMRSLFSRSKGLTVFNSKIREDKLDVKLREDLTKLYPGDANKIDYVFKAAERDVISYAEAVEVLDLIEEIPDDLFKRSVEGTSFRDPFAGELTSILNKAAMGSYHPVNHQVTLGTLSTKRMDDRDVAQSPRGRTGSAATTVAHELYHAITSRHLKLETEQGRMMTKIWKKHRRALRRVMLELGYEKGAVQYYTGSAAEFWAEGPVLLTRLLNEGTESQKRNKFLIHDLVKGMMHFVTKIYKFFGNEELKKMTDLKGRTQKKATSAMADIRKAIETLANSKVVSEQEVRSMWAQVASEAGLDYGKAMTNMQRMMDESLVRNNYEQVVRASERYMKSSPEIQKSLDEALKKAKEAGRDIPKGFMFSPEIPMSPALLDSPSMKNNPPYEYDSVWSEGDDKLFKFTNSKDTEILVSLSDRDNGLMEINFESRNNEGGHWNIVDLTNDGNVRRLFNTVIKIAVVEGEKLGFTDASFSRVGKGMAQYGRMLERYAQMLDVGSRMNYAEDIMDFRVRLSAPDSDRPMPTPPAMMMMMDSGGGEGLPVRGDMGEFVPDHLQKPKFDDDGTPGSSRGSDGREIKSSTVMAKKGLNTPYDLAVDNWLDYKFSKGEYAGRRGNAGRQGLDAIRADRAKGVQNVNNLFRYNQSVIGSKAITDAGLIDFRHGNVYSEFGANQWLQSMTNSMVMTKLANAADEFRNERTDGENPVNAPTGVRGRMKTRGSKDVMSFDEYLLNMHKRLRDEIQDIVKNMSDSEVARMLKESDSMFRRTGRLAQADADPRVALEAQLNAELDTAMDKFADDYRRGIKRASSFDLDDPFQLNMSEAITGVSRLVSAPGYGVAALTEVFRTLATMIAKDMSPGGVGFAVKTLLTGLRDVGIRSSRNTGALEGMIFDVSNYRNQMASRYEGGVTGVDTTEVGTNAFLDGPMARFGAAMERIKERHANRLNRGVNSSISRIFGIPGDLMAELGGLKQVTEFARYLAVNTIKRDFATHLRKGRFQALNDNLDSMTRTTKAGKEAPTITAEKRAVITKALRAVGVEESIDDMTPRQILDLLARSSEMVGKEIVDTSSGQALQEAARDLVKKIARDSGLDFASAMRAMEVGITDARMLSAFEVLVPDGQFTFNELSDMVEGFASGTGDPRFAAAAKAAGVNADDLRDALDMYHEMVVRYVSQEMVVEQRGLGALSSTYSRTPTGRLANVLLGWPRAWFDQVGSSAGGNRGMTSWAIGSILTFAFMDYMVNGGRRVLSGKEEPEEAWALFTDPTQMGTEVINMLNRLPLLGNAMVVQGILAGIANTSVGAFAPGFEGDTPFYPTVGMSPAESVTNRLLGPAARRLRAGDVGGAAVGAAKDLYVAPTMTRNIVGAPLGAAASTALHANDSAYAEGFDKFIGRSKSTPKGRGHIAKSGGRIGNEEDVLTAPVRTASPATIVPTAEQRQAMAPKVDVDRAVSEVQSGTSKVRKPSVRPISPGRKSRSASTPLVDRLNKRN